jgi:Uma2 family endonuclease
MSQATLISAQEYLHTSYDPDCEYVDGEVIERNVGETDHSKLQMAVAAFFYALRHQEFVTYPECRVQVSRTRYRVPDITVTIGEAEGRIIRQPPFLVVEVFSPEDRIGYILEKVRDYIAFGVPNIWLIDPQRRAYLGTEAGLLEVTGALVTKEPPVTLPLASLWQELPPAALSDQTES